MKFLFLFAFFIGISFSQDNGLPRYMTDDEKKIGNNYESIPQVSFTPPSTPFRILSEWQEIEGIVITWTSYLPVLRQIVDAAQEQGTVWIICSDSTSVRSYLQSGGVPLVNIQCIVNPFNSVWSRDYGPWSIYTLAGDTLGIVDLKYNRPRPLDDNVPVVLANRWSLPLYQAISGQDSLAHPGGNFIIDGLGTGFASNLILMENPWHTSQHIDTILMRYCGINPGRMIKMTVLPYDGIHHIDMHMKLLDEETLLVGQYPTGVADGPQIETNLQFIQNNYLNGYGKPYKIVRIPMPPSSGGQYPPNSNYYTYTNSLIVNKTVLVPIYNFPQDTTAIRIYRENMPGYNVIGIDCNSMISAGGALHCIAKEIGVRDPVFISHSGVRNTNNTSQPYEIKAYIKTRSGVANARMFWSIDTSLGFTQVNMSNIGDTFRANIPPRPLGTKVYYYISATSNSNRTVNKPLTAPLGNYQFLITNITGVTQINNNMPEKFVLYQNYPNPFNPSTKIKFDIPSQSSVTLKIYDINGKEILIPIKQIMQPGSYSLELNWSEFASGVYFYKLSASNFNSVKKMVIVK
ncbi:MAG TPA: hypothetical protein DCY06_11475 [Bacteroidetes bacterium]|nr:hypothetical protein [Bacteroidota bacterium]HCN37383.1 hypothetical protein [Bacteroidota bacterium]HRF67528.1 agmatine deiminase family protein [Ignavibacteria bacterium]HRJ84663.1 agmatine deiminase family protein [Ignavibacteria bacterium]